MHCINHLASGESYLNDEQFLFFADNLNEINKTIMNHGSIIDSLEDKLLLFKKRREERAKVKPFNLP